MGSATFTRLKNIGALHTLSTRNEKVHKKIRWIAKTIVGWDETIITTLLKTKSLSSLNCEY